MNSVENMGLSLLPMQSILDAQKNILMSVDQGITKLSRNNFLKNFEMHLNALQPRPKVSDTNPW